MAGPQCAAHGTHPPIQSYIVAATFTRRCTRKIVVALLQLKTRSSCPPPDARRFAAHRFPKYKALGFSGQTTADTHAAWWVSMFTRDHRRRVHRLPT
mmetsp:Transcript_21884/g.56292  ORF Transcript_21884/g.56292 Transcript_21884/m.56292 type:complete len:97 (-) Transcript_21884:89-379(-)